MHCSSDDLAKNINSVKFSQVGQDVFDRTVDAHERKTKDSKWSGRPILAAMTKRNWQKNCNDKVTNFAGEFQRLCKGIGNYSTRSKTNAAVTQRILRLLKKVFAVTGKSMNSIQSELLSFCHNAEVQVEYPERLDIIKTSKILNFVHSIQQSTIKIEKLKFQLGIRVHISKYDLIFSMGQKPQFI